MSNKSDGIQLKLRLHPDAVLESTPPDQIVITKRNLPYPLADLSPILYEVFSRLGEQGTTRTALRLAVSQAGKVPDVLRLEREVNQLILLGVLIDSLEELGQPIARRISVSPLFRPQKFDSALRYVPSRFAYLHTVQGQIVLELPLTHAFIQFQDWRGAALFTALQSDPHPPQLPGFSDEATQALITLLVETGLLVRQEADGKTAEDQHPDLAAWEFHDLMFHAHSRRERNTSPIGAIYRLRGEQEHLPVIKPPMSESVIALTVPDMDHLMSTDRSFAWVMEHRRSRRRREDESLSLDQIGEFLYRTVRVQQEFSNADYHASFRPYPSGGAIHELEFYLATDRCDGLPDGLYHYCPKRHVLETLPVEVEQSRRLINETGWALEMNGRAHVLLFITALFQRLSWKYAGIAYSLALKHVGIVQQSFYLAATAMGLLPCAIGSGNSDIFCRIAGLDYYAEPSIGEFALS